MYFFDLLRLAAGLGRFTSGRPDSEIFGEASGSSNSNVFEVADGVLESVRDGDLGTSLEINSDASAFSLPVTASEVARRPIARLTFGATFLRGADVPSEGSWCLKGAMEKDDKNPPLELADSSNLVTVGE